VYFDHAATAPLRDEARDALQSLLARPLGNPSSLHAAGREARTLLTQARRTFADVLGCPRDGVVFTGNGSEANVLALAGSIHDLPRTRRHVLTTPVEHPSVLDCLRELQRQGAVEIELLPVDRSGRVAIEDVRACLRDATGLVSVMLVNNELGTIEPVAAIAEVLCRSPDARKPLLHCDASQAIGKIPASFGALGCDLMTVSPHKFGGPPGIGVLLVRSGVSLHSPLSAGRQEAGLRGGTESVAACAAAAAALRAAVEELPREGPRLHALAEELARELRARFPDLVVHSPERDVVPGLVNVSIPGVPGAWFVAAMDRRGVAISHGSACASLAAVPSHVLAAIGAGAFARSSVRVSMGRGSTRDDVAAFLARAAAAVAEIREACGFCSSQNGHNR
jgi:cysteine desulfurase